MAPANQEEIKAIIGELKCFLEQSKQRKVKDLLSLEVRKWETELINIQTSLRPDVPVEVVADSSQKQQTKRYEVKLNGYGWDQSEKFVKVFVTLKNVQSLSKENVYCTLTDRSMQLHVKDLENKDYILVINNLLEPINIAESHWKQKTDMVVVFLAKSRPNVNWSHMTEIEKRFEEKKSNKFNSNSETQDPQDSIMSLMKNMYESGDDDMKRMIAKAWTEGQQKKNSTDIGGL